MNYQKYIPLIARVFLAVIFLRGGISHLFDFSGPQQMMAQRGLPLPGLLLLGNIVSQLVGASLLLLGYKTRLGAILLILFLIPTTLVFHTNFSQEMQVIAFFKNLGIIGGLLMVVYAGAGPVSLDERTQSRETLK
jgi:uncharacterized membrane protein YphA (DoxX/SURF4 family)